MGKAGMWAVDRYRDIRKFCKKVPVPAERIRRIRRLYPREEPEEVLRRLDGEQISRVGMFFLAGCFLCGLFLWQGKKEAPISVLKRPDYGEKELVYELEAQRENGDRLPMEVTVPEQMLTEAEAEKRMEEAYGEICRSMLGENDSLDHVEGNLELPEKALDGTVSIEWTSRSRELFNDWGELVKGPGELSPEGETGIYELSLHCGGYECRYELLVAVYPPEQTEEEELRETVKTELEQKTGKEGQGGILELPDTYKGEKLIWFQRGEARDSLWVLAVLPAVCILLLARGRQQEKEKLKEREKEMLMDYPEMVSKFTVLLQAGLAARNVWERMVAEYEEQKESGKKPRYAYEEMAITWNQLKNGMYESRAYGEFGRRCGLHTYMKFGALLEQNLRQGTTGLALRLKEEALSAFEERKNLARRLGEEAETRLMLPMFLMLFMVLTVIMVPAFLSF